MFNASHAVAYAYISYLMAWLKYHHPIEFFAATLSLTDDTKENGHKRQRYIHIAEEFAGIQVTTPDINHSEEDFTFDVDKNLIYYGLSSIKGVGEKSYQTIIENRPYTSLRDVYDKVPKKFFNKTAGIALIKSGAFDEFNSNRLALLKEFYTIRKEKFENFDTSGYNDKMSIDMEREVLGINLTSKTWWESVPRNQKVEIETAFIVNIREHKDRRGRLMAFLELSIESCDVSGIAFASTYSKYQAALTNKYKKVSLVGKKDDKDSFIIDAARIA